MRAIARDVTELFDCRGLSNPAAIKGKTQQSNRTQEQDDPKTTQLSLGDYDRMRVVKPDSVPTQLTTKYRELFVSSGMTQTDAWNNALNDYEKSGHAVQPEKHQAYRDGCERFVTDTDYANLAHFPRYLKAINVRLEKLRADPARDARLMAEWAQAAAPWQRAQKDRHSGKADPKMAEFRWLLEELRVSMFAQELRTPMPVSVKRLQKVWESMQR